MNYLAHAWLARHSDDAILGAILGDFVHGQSALADWPPAVRAEGLWGRRSLFCQGALGVLVAEVFLPALWRADAATSA